VRKITPDGKINTIAGTPNSAGYSGDGGAATAAQLNSICSIALDSAGNVYFCDGANNRVRKISADGIIYTIVGNGVNANSGDGGLASQASINGPHGAFVDSDGSVLISSYSGGVVRKIFAPSLSLSASATVPQPGQSVTFTAQLVDATLTVLIFLGALLCQLPQGKRYAPAVLAAQVRIKLLQAIRVRKYCRVLRTVPMPPLALLPV
jgi:hypothetical protein